MRWRSQCHNPNGCRHRCRQTPRSERSAGAFACSQGVVRGEVEPPTFRFSGLRVIVQGWPCWSSALLGARPWPVVDLRARACMRLGMRLRTCPALVRATLGRPSWTARRRHPSPGQCAGPARVLKVRSVPGKRAMHREVVGARFTVGPRHPGQPRQLHHCK